MSQRAIDPSPDRSEIAKNLLSMIPMERFGEASEVAELICWLLCEGSSYITGTVQSIDGGWAA